MKKQKLIDRIVKEPLGGAHTDKEGAYLAVSNAIEKAYAELLKLSPENLVKKRMDKYCKMGVFKS